MAVKKIHRLWSLFGWQFEEIESWLEDMACKGWHLSHNGPFSAVFVKGEPSQDRYRCDYFQVRNPEWPDRINLYKDAGWEYIFSCGTAHIFRAPAGELAPEIPSGPEGIHSSAALIRLLSFVPLWMVVMAGALIVTLILRWPELLMGVLLTNSVSSWLTIPCLAYAVFFMIWHGWRCFKTLTRLRQRVYYSRKPWKTARWINKAGAIIVLALLVSLGSEFYNLTPVIQSSLPTGNVVHIQQLLPEIQLTLWAGYREDGSFLIPEQWYFSECVREVGVHYPHDSGFPPQGEYEPILSVDGFKARNDWLALQLARILAKEASGGMPIRQPISRALILETPFNALWLFATPVDSEFIALQGKYVFDITYTGREPLSWLFQPLKEVIDSLEEGE